MSDETQFVCPHCKQKIKHCAGLTYGDVMSLRHNKKHQEIMLELLLAEVEKLRAALQFYAEEKNWRRNGPLDANGGNYTGGPASSVLGEQTTDDYLSRLYACTNEAIKAIELAADQGKFDTRCQSVNWADLGCVSAQYVVDHDGYKFYRVVIEEVSSGAVFFHKFIYDYLTDHGFPDVEVSLEW
jgi:hypothetical protein